MGRKPFDRRNGASATIDRQAKRLRGPCVKDSFGKCRKCGATMRCRLDLQLHYCAPRDEDAMPKRSRMESVWG